MAGNITIAREPVDITCASNSEITASEVWLRVIDAGKIAICLILVPIAFSLACLGLFIFGLVARFSDKSLRQSRCGTKALLPGICPLTGRQSTGLPSFLVGIEDGNVSANGP